VDADAQIRLLVVDDHPLVREGLRTLLDESPDVLCVAEASSGEEALLLASDADADVALVDLVMPGMDGIETIRRLRRASPRTRVVALTSFADEKRVRDAMDAGALGYLLKDVLKDDLLRAIRNAHAGRPTLHPAAQRHLRQRARRDDRRAAVDRLTPRERSVLELMGQGRSNQAIADTLHLSPGTVKGHVSRILGKLGVEDRTQAALVALREGLVGRS
jgi:RNA polymerase sigma factor (sigma-70 family)